VEVLRKFSISKYSDQLKFVGTLKVAMNYLFIINIYFIALLRLKRANSGALEGDPSTPLSTEDFRRGGTLRATAGHV
jgi:hypothetical protein